MVFPYNLWLPSLFNVHLHIPVETRSKDKYSSGVDPDVLEEQRNRRTKETKMEDSLQQIIVYVIYMVVVTIISYGQRDPMAYYITKHIEDSLIRDTVSVYKDTGFNKVNFTFNTPWTGKSLFYTIVVSLHIVPDKCIEYSLYSRFQLSKSLRIGRMMCCC